MRLHISYILFVIIAFPAYSLNGILKGKVLDSKSKSSIEYVTIRVENADTKSFVTGSVTDGNGDFHINNLNVGKYLVEVSMIGYVTETRSFIITDGANAVSLADILLKEDSQMLNEVVVVGQQSQMRFDIDKRVFNVGQNISAVGGSASDILSNIPSVNVDSEGEISFRGNSSVTIWINGKASGLTADNSAQILEQLPAESIDRVELITNPSAKYNPEGTAGIINIILKQNRKSGYYGSAQAGVDTRGGYNLGGNINYTSNKLETYLNINHRVKKGKGEGYTNRNNLDESGNTVSYLNQIRKDKEKDWPYFLRTGLTYHFTPKDQIGFNFFGMLDNEKEDDMMDYLSNVSGSFINSFRLSEDRNKMTIGNFELNYKRVFNEKSNLGLSVSRQYFDREATPVFNQFSVYEDGSEHSSYQRQSNDNSARSWELQADYTNEITENDKLEFGYKGDISRRESPVETYSGASASTALFDETLYNHFFYNQDVHALYVTYSKQIGKIGILAGLRGEYTNMETKSLAYANTDVVPYKNDYFSLYPSIFLSYALPDNNELQLNYTRRVSRPNGRQLNPFINITDSTNISYGNPYLTPQYSNSIELNYIKNWDNHTLSASLFYRNTNDVIQRINYLEDNIMKTTFENIAKTQAAGTELILKNRLFKTLDITTTMSLYYSKLDGFTYTPFGATNPIVQKDDDNLSWNGRIMANTILPYNISFQVTGNYDSKQIIAQGYKKANGSIDLGFRKTFMDNKLSLAISARDILDSRKRVNITSGDGFYQQNSFRRLGRTFGFTLTFSFGSMGKSNDANDNENNENSPIMDLGED